MSPTATKKGRYKVRASKALSEKEALALISTAAFRGGIFDAIKNEIFRLVNSGQHYGCVDGASATGERMTEDECKKCVSALNADFKKRNFAFRVLYVPAKDTFAFVPESKYKEAFGR